MPYGLIVVEIVKGFRILSVKQEAKFHFDGVLMTGPFRDCKDFIDPDAYHESCMYDACALGSDTVAVCSTFEQYAQNCRRHVQSIRDWRAALDQCCTYLSSLSL